MKSSATKQKSKIGQDLNVVSVSSLLCLPNSEEAIDLTRWYFLFGNAIHDSDKSFLRFPVYHNGKKMSIAIYGRTKTIVALSAENEKAAQDVIMKVVSMIRTVDKSVMMRRPTLVNVIYQYNHNFTKPGDQFHLAKLQRTLDREYFETFWELSTIEKKTDDETGYVRKKKKAEGASRDFPSLNLVYHNKTEKYRIFCTVFATGKIHYSRLSKKPPKKNPKELVFDENRTSRTREFYTTSRYNENIDLTTNGYLKRAQMAHNYILPPILDILAAP